MFDTSLITGKLFGSLRHALDTTLGIFQNRIELAAVELQEEKSRAISMLIWAMVGIFTGFMAVIALMLTLVFLFWEQALIVMACFLAVFLIGAAAAFFTMKSKLKNPAIPFEETINQLKKDRLWIRSWR